MLDKLDIKKCKEVYLRYSKERPVVVDKEHVDHMYIIDRIECIGTTEFDISIYKNWVMYRRYVALNMKYLNTYEDLMSYIRLDKRERFLADTLMYLDINTLRLALDMTYGNGHLENVVTPYGVISNLYKVCRDDTLIEQLDDNFYVYFACLKGETEEVRDNIEWYLNWVDCAYHKMLIGWSNKSTDLDIRDIPGVNMRDPDDIEVYKMKVSRDNIVAYKKMYGTVLVDHDVLQYREIHKYKLGGVLVE